ncbi:MAG: adenosylmethionine--8-amino-7-oxononanoate transaminase [Candidatus Obscuribacterales bacterium]|nr:adenosylmethionine--8-amino-7-oxononanoate transaminase [Candidatus Obscuribacterales bacterium]
MTMNAAKRDCIWRPFTQMLNAEPPLMVRSGNGVFLELEDGKKIVDCISSWWVNLHGHARKEIADAIAEQANKLEQVIFAGFTHEPAEKLAERLLTHLPSNLKHVFYSDNGSTAVEVALKLAFQYWLNNGKKKNKFIAFEGGYHGDTAGSMSIGQGSPFWNTFEPLLFSIELAPFPSTFDNDSFVQEKESRSLNRLKEILDKDGDNIAAICIEPLIQGAGGMRFCRPQFLKDLRALCNQHEVLLIFDEVMTGFGRTGDWFAACRADVQPDLICISKGITGGFLPLSVTACSSTIFDAFLSTDHSKTFFHGHSYTANPLACAAAIASMDLLESDPTVFSAMEARHKTFMNKHIKDHPRLIQQRVCGTIFAAEIQSKEEDSYFNSVAPILKKRFIEKGFLIRPLGNTVYLMPPYCIDDDILEAAYKVIAKCCASI